MNQQIRIKLTLCLSIVFLAIQSFGQTASENNKKKLTISMGSSTADSGKLDPLPVKKAYWSTNFGMSMLSSAWFSRPGKEAALSTLRFSYFFNAEFLYNYNYDDNFGLFTGIGVKNLGMIEKNGDSSLKRRVYALGIPIGFKIGDFKKHQFLFLGGGVDFPVNYKQKSTVNRKDKVKMNEWFSKRTESYMPYIFIGASLNQDFQIKFQYYPQNFFNVDYTEVKNNVSVKPYTGYNAQLFFVTLSYGLKLNVKK